MGSLFSVALFLRVASRRALPVILALWSPDFPHSKPFGFAARPSCLTRAPYCKGRSGQSQGGRTPLCRCAASIGKMQKKICAGKSLIKYGRRGIILYIANVQRGVFVYDAARISARHEGKDRRGHRPRREQPSARGAAGAERCEGHRLRQEGARGARRRSGALRGARRGAAPRRGLSARSGRGRCLPHARDAARRAGAAGGEGARRGHHERDGGVLRRLSVSRFSA